MPRKIALALVLLAAWFVVPVPAQDAPPAPRPTDPVADLIHEALGAWRGEKPQQAIELLQKAIGRIQDGMRKGMAGLLPQAPDGWKAGEVESKSGNWGSGGNALTWNQVGCTYTDERGDKVTVKMTNMPRLVDAQRRSLEVLKDPRVRQVMESKPGLEFDLIERAGWLALLTVQTGHSCQIAAHGKGTLVTVESNVPDRKRALLFFDALDLKSIDAVFGSAEDAQKGTGRRGG